jgi:hypothetical protein
MDTVAGGARSAGWYVEHLQSTLVVGRSVDRLLERWSIVAQQALDEVLIEVNLDGPCHSAAVPGGPPWCEIEAMGAELTPDPWPLSTGGRPVVAVLFPDVLVAPADRHVFEIQACIRGGQPRRRHVVVPPVHCRTLDLRVHFAGPVVPRGVQSIRDAAAPQVPVDVTGDVHLRLSNVRPGAAYGVHWTDAERALDAS